MNIQNLIGLTTGENSLKLNGQNVQNTSATGEDETNEPVINATQTVGEEFSTFLTLLTAQIRNQDPLAPLDSTQFVEQLATFSGLELQATANNSLETIANLLAQNLYAANPTKLDATQVS